MAFIEETVHMGELVGGCIYDLMATSITEESHLIVLCTPSMKCNVNRSSTWISPPFERYSSKCLKLYQNISFCSNLGPIYQNIPLTLKIILIGCIRWFGTSPNN